MIREKRILPPLLLTMPSLSLDYNSAIWYDIIGKGRIPMAEERKINREYKDRLFKFIFGNPDKKEWTLSLYNAMNGSHYTDPEAITLNMIEDAVYMGM